MKQVIDQAGLAELMSGKETVLDPDLGPCFRSDEMRVIQRMPGVVDIEFRWRGELTYVMRVDCDFSIGQLLTLSGIYVMMPFSLTST